MKTFLYTNYVDYNKINKLYVILYLKKFLSIGKIEDSKNILYIIF